MYYKNDTFDTEKRDKYELDAYQWTTTVYTNMSKQYNINITDIKKSEDEYSSYDVTANINGQLTYIENKTRDSSKYHYDDSIFKDGYYLASAKNNGENTLFNYWFPQDKVVMITNDKQLNHLVPKKTWVRHIKNCDPNSPSGYVFNYLVPKGNWWIYHYNEDKVELISKPCK